MSNIVNQVAYLRTSRAFPEDAQALSLELTKSYIDIANAVNSRTIGIFPSNRPAVSGESWFVSKNQRQQTLRQVYPFSGNFTAINHGINLEQIAGFTRIYGTFQDNATPAAWYPAPYVNPTANQQVGIKITSTQITFIVGGAAPTAVSGFVILEWLSNP